MAWEPSPKGHQIGLNQADFHISQPISTTSVSKTMVVQRSLRLKPSFAPEWFRYTVWLVAGSVWMAVPPKVP